MLAEKIRACSSVGSPWDISNAVYVRSLFLGGVDSTPTGLFFKPDGLKMYVTGDSTDRVYEYDLSTAWDVTTASYLQDLYVYNHGRNPEAIFFKPNGLRMYVLGTTYDTVYEYKLL